VSRKFSAAHNLPADFLFHPTNLENTATSTVYTVRSTLYRLHGQFTVYCPLFTFDILQSTFCKYSTLCPLCIDKLLVTAYLQHSTDCNIPFPVDSLQSTLYGLHYTAFTLQSTVTIHSLLSTVYTTKTTDYRLNLTQYKLTITVHKVYLNCIIRNGFLQTITKATHINNNSSTFFIMSSLITPRSLTVKVPSLQI
jgi:hypothetical protein